MIGQGAFGKVIEAIDIETGEELAVKVYRFCSRMDKDLSDLLFILLKYIESGHK